MLAMFVWAGYIIVVRIKNDGPAYRAKPAAAG
jgi:hypothetical protein